MDRPIGYLYRVGQSRTRARKEPQRERPTPVQDTLPDPEEVMYRPYAPAVDKKSTRTSRGRQLVAAAAIAVLALTGAALWTQLGQRTPANEAVSVASRGQAAPSTETLSSTPTSLDPSTSPAIDPTTCGPSNRCRATVTQAEQALGIRLPDPQGIPAGWEPVESKWTIRYWPESWLSPGDPAVADYNQAWAPAGEDLDAPGATPTYVQIRRRTTLGDEAFNGSPVALPNGVTAYNTLDRTLAWKYQGVTTQVTAVGLSLENLQEIAASLV